MSYADNPYAAPSYTFADQAAADERAGFIAKTYTHLAGAIAAFIALEAVLLNMPGIENLVGLMIGTRYGWLAVLGLFMVVSWIADGWARSAISPTKQYWGLGLYVVAEAVIFVPLLFIAQRVDTNIIPLAGIYHAGAVRCAHRHRDGHAQGLLVPPHDPALRRLCGDGTDRRLHSVRLCLGPDLYVRHDRLRLRLHFVRHLQRAAPLSHRPAHRGGAGAVRFRGPAVLVHRAALPVVAPLTDHPDTARRSCVPRTRRKRVQRQVVQRIDGVGGERHVSRIGSLAVSCRSTGARAGGSEEIGQ